MKPVVLFDPCPRPRSCCDHARFLSFALRRARKEPMSNCRSVKPEHLYADWGQLAGYGFHCPGSRLLPSLWGRRGLALLVDDRLRRHSSTELGRVENYLDALPPMIPLLDRDERHLHVRPVVRATQADVRAGSRSGAEQGTARPVLFRAVFYLPSLSAAASQSRCCGGKSSPARPAQSGAEWLFGYEGPSWISNPSYFALYDGAAGGLAVRLVDDHLPRRLAPNPARHVRGGKHRRRQRARQFFKITLPLLTPVIFFNAVILTIDAFKAFTSAFVISDGTGGPINSTCSTRSISTRRRSPISASATLRRWPGCWC